MLRSTFLALKSSGLQTDRLRVATLMNFGPGGGGHGSVFGGVPNEATRVFWQEFVQSRRDFRTMMRIEIESAFGERPPPIDGPAA